MVEKVTSKESQGGNRQAAAAGARKVECLEIETENSYYGRNNNSNISSSSREGLSFLMSKVAIINYVALLVLLILFFVDRTVEQIEAEADAVVSIGTYRVSHNSPHSSSFGGINNIAQPGGAKAAAAGEGIGFFMIPISNVGHAIKSLNSANMINHWGHYVHDEHRSPYASHLYDQPKEFLEEQQQKFVAKMEVVRTEWGAWDFTDPNPDRPVADFDPVDYRDMSNDDLPSGSWQTDEDYVARFLKEARALVDRVQEGIYAEYGWPLKKPDGTTLSEEEKRDREEKWKIHIVSEEDNPADYKNGIAVLSQVAMDGLVRKLLHAMITNDQFYAVLAGHSAAAGHGNNFQQNRIITFHKIMEPVLDKLGVRLISRNMAMGGVGTLHFSLAGGDLYGEADVMIWDSGMTENGPPVDLFNKQAILSGERVPLIISDNHFDILEETKGTAWMAKYILDYSMIPKTTWDNFESIPYAARWFDENENKEEKYNAVCWEPRLDFHPLQTQDDKPGSQVSWHPGHRFHQFAGRRLALIILYALRAAFDKWEEGISNHGFPLSESYWHIKQSYQIIRDNLRTHITTPKTTEGEQNDVRSECEKLIDYLPRICRVQMHGFGMWTPRADLDYDLLNIINPAKNGYKPFMEKDNVYKGFDLLPLNQAIPDGQVDVHAIAIATTSPPPNLDHSWLEDSEQNNLGENQTASASVDPPRRRWLKEVSEKAFRKVHHHHHYHHHHHHQQQQQQLQQQQYQHQHQQQKFASRRKLENDIVPGRGWEVHGWSVVNGLCDGSAQSECKRTENERCLLYGANDNHLDVWGNGLSGWLVFTLPKVKEGIILVRMEWWCGNGKNSLTQGWSEVDDGKTMDTTPWNATATESDRHRHRSLNNNAQRRRRLGKAKLEDYVPDDFEMDYAVNGEIKTMKRDEWVTHVREYVKNVAVWPILNDITMAEKDWDGEPMEVAIRFRTNRLPQQNYCISHVYYA